MGGKSSREDIEKEAGRIESMLTGILDNYATQITVTARSKRWWIPYVEAKRKEYGRIRRFYQQERANVFTLKAKGNSYYYTIRRAKRPC